MAVFNMQIAGRVAQVSSLFESTPEYFRPYLTQAAPDFTVTVSPSDVEFEREFHLREALEEGFRVRNFPDTFLERAAIQRAFAEYLLDHKTLLFHGSTVAVDGQAYLFTAKSGTGKSTHTRLWREVFGHRAVMVNDDKPFLKFTDDAILACGSPWSGKHGLDSNICVPLKGICILVRGAQNSIRRITPEEAMPMLLQQSYHPQALSRLESCRQLTQQLSAQIPLWFMQCNKDPQAAEIAYAAMANIPEC